MSIAVPKSHEFYEDFIQALELDIVEIEYAAGGVILVLGDRRTIEFTASGDSKISLTICNKLGERTAWPVDFEPNHIIELWSAVY